jgi:signal transduction histidine kinase
MTNTKPARILLVDDEESVRETMAAILQRAGYDIVAAPSGEKALEHVNSEQFDLLLTDLRMEGMTGVELMAELRKHSPDTPSIMLTGYASLDSAIEALREGAYDYLVKPCHVDILKAAVARGVERGALARSLRERIEELDAVNDELRAFSDELEQRVDRATADLSHKVEELAETNRQLEEATRLREAFISVAAHELKTPISSLRLSAQLAERVLQQTNTPDQERLSRQIQTVIDQSVKLARLVEQMLDVSRVKAGRLEIQPEPTDLVALIEGIVDHARQKTTKHTISVLAEGPLEANMDPLRIEQVLVNLLDNAIKYSPSGGPIDIQSSQEADGEVQISVTDNGIGIPLEHRERVFEQFYQAHAGGSAAGMGLGLYISRQIAELHGGTLEAEFPEEGGSRFVLTLPKRPSSPHG